MLTHLLLFARANSKQIQKLPMFRNCTVQFWSSGANCLCLSGASVSDAQLRTPCPVCQSVVAWNSTITHHIANNSSPVPKPQVCDCTEGPQADRALLLWFSTSEFSVHKLDLHAAGPWLQIPTQSVFPKLRGGGGAFLEVRFFSRSYSGLFWRLVEAKKKVILEA